MNETKVKAIVIGSKDYKEKDKLVELFTLEYGIITTLFKGVKNNNAKLKSAKEIFTFGDFIYINGNFKTVTSADVISNFFGITKNLKSYYTACNILAIIKAVLAKEQTSPTLFVDTLKCLSLLDGGEVDNNLILAKYLIRVFEGFGYKFTLGACNNCGNKFLNHIYMNMRHGDITCARCRVGEVQEITPSVYSTLRILSGTEYEKLGSLKLHDTTKAEMLKLLTQNLENRFGVKLSL